MMICRCVSTEISTSYGISFVLHSAFRDTPMVSLTTGNSVATIGNSAFCGCSGLTGALIIPDSVISSIGEQALADFSNGGLPPYGYLRKAVEVRDELSTVKQKLTWELAPQTAPAVHQAFDAYLVGKGRKKIADDLTTKDYRVRRGRPWINPRF